MLFTYAVLETSNQLVIKTVVAGEKDLLHLFQKSVGGFIQDLYISDKTWGIFCNDEGLYTCHSNKHAAEFIRFLDSNSTYQNLHGNILFVGINDSEEISLAPEQIVVLRNIAEQMGLTIAESK